MHIASLEALVSALNAAGVRFLVAGGLAVGAHGYPRLTMDVDLVVELGVDNIVAAFHALAGLGYKPLVPVTAEAFSDKAQRERWIEEKGMQVLNFFSDQHKSTSVDLFVTEPFDFDTEYDNALKGDLARGLPVRFVSIPTLIRMKELAGRPRDLDDIQHLRWILNDRKQDEPGK
ncbi:MAG: nucleotidyl transferase AbiEii/AbiGii toxin family protein [Acidimicrobiia bacterium]